MQTTEQKQQNSQTVKPTERLAQAVFLAGSILAFVVGLMYLVAATFNPNASSIVDGLQQVTVKALVGVGWLLVAIFMQLLLAITGSDLLKRK